MLFGSLAREGCGRDVDVLVVPCEGVRLEARAYLELVSELGWRLGADVDVVELGAAPCPVVVDAWRHGFVWSDIRRRTRLVAGLAGEADLVMRNA